MSETARLTLPLLDAAQAQKHVTINEALTRLDALGAGRAEALEQTAPPPAPAEGSVWGVGTAPTGDWAGQAGTLALFLNGGWVFVAPWEGLALWSVADGAPARFLGGAWRLGAVAGSPGGALTVMRVVEEDHAIAPGAVSVTSALIPDKGVVTGVTARVLTEITGAASWSIGVAGSPDRYGAGFGTAAGAFAHGVTGQPQAYFGATALELAAAGGAFSGGVVRIAVHLTEIAPPL